MDIGILSSIVLASLNTARTKAKDAAVKSQLSSMRSQGEIYYSGIGNYSGLCGATKASGGFGGVAGPGLLKATADANAVTLTNPAVVITATAGVFNTVTCHDSTTAWVVEAPLSGSAASPNIKMFCVDSTTITKEKNSNIAASDLAC